MIASAHKKKTIKISKIAIFQKVNNKYFFLNNISDLENEDGSYIANINFVLPWILRFFL